MLQNKYKTNSLMRCKDFSFAIPLGSILALLLVLITAMIVPSSNNVVLALEINSNSNNDGASSAGTGNSTNTNTSNSLSNNNDNINNNTNPSYNNVSSNDNYTNTIATANNTNNDDDANDTNTNNNLSAYNATTYANNALSLSIGGAGQSEAVKTVAGEVAYRAHTVNVSATNMKTYSISINGPVGLKNDTGNTTIIGAGNTIPNGTGSTMMPNNSWGYAYGQTGDNANMTYSSFTNADQVIDTANTTPNFTKNLVFAAKFGEEANVGHYTATVTLSITATPKVITEYTLSYNANGGSNAPTLQTYTDDTEAGSHTFTIPSTKPTRSGYEFAGWSTTSTGTASYQPGGSITLQAANPSQTLYAKWNQVYTRTVSYNANGGSGAPSSQSCSSTSTSCSITISSTKPTRSGYTFLGWSTSSTASSASYSAGGSISISSNTTLYAVWKTNSAVWSNGVNSGITYMQDITTGTGTNSFCKSSLPTHASITLKDRRDESSYTIVKMADGKCWMTSNLKIVNKTITSADSDVSSSFTIPASSISGFSSSNASNAYVSGNTGYYTWCAATAGTCSSATSDGSNASSSICPKNWKLPTGGSSTSTSDFGKFATAEGITNSSAGSTKIRGIPYNFAYSGRVSDGAMGLTSYGFWWSRTAYNSNNAYDLYIDGSNVSPGTDYNGRYLGFAVRCVAQ